MDTPQIEIAAHLAPLYQTGKRCCSDCYETLHYTFKWNRETKQNEHFISCGTPGCPMNGTISRHTVRIRESDAHARYNDAKHALRDSIPWLKPETVSETELLAELGFPT